MAISFSPRSVFFALYASVAARLDTAAAESVRGSRRRKERQLSDFLEMSRWLLGDGQCGEEGVRALRREPAHELRRAGRVARLAEAEVGLEPEAVGRCVVDRDSAARRERDEAAALGLLGVDDGRPAAGDRDHEAAHPRAERLAVVCAQQRPAGSAQEHGGFAVMRASVFTIDGPDGVLDALVIAGGRAADGQRRVHLDLVVPHVDILGGTAV